jgi:hypothetical protein
MASEKKQRIRDNVRLIIDIPCSGNIPAHSVCLVSVYMDCRSEPSQQGRTVCI